MILIPPVPTASSPDWLRAFGAHLLMLKPRLRTRDAEFCAVLAYPGVWLLEPDEAAELWLAAMEVAARERALKGWHG